MLGEEVTKAVWLMGSKPEIAARKVHLGAQPECLLSLEFILIILPAHLTPLQSSRVQGRAKTVITYAFCNMKTHFLWFHFM